jgi:RNA polymerase sigma factor (sigma-70 family)
VTKRLKARRCAPGRSVPFEFTEDACMESTSSFVDHDVAIHIAGRSIRSIGMNVSFESFYRGELRGQVQRAALLLGSATSANDVVHDAFIAVFQRWESLENPGPYLNRCVLNGCRDLLRRQRSAPNESRPSFVGDRADDVAVWDGLAGLPFRQRAAIVMRYWQGMEEFEIAHALGIRPGTVGSLLTRGKRNLERRWNK